MEYLNFLKKPYINLLGLTDEESSKVCHTLLDKIIFQDIPQRFPVDEPELLKRLMQIVCSQPGFMAQNGDRPIPGTNHTFLPFPIS